MPHTPTPTPESHPANEDGDGHDGPGYASAEGLRALLDRLHDAGPGVWRHDPEAAELMRYTADRYAALARKHHCDPQDAATAAFEAMLNPSTRTAADPWAVVTTAVRITLIADERAHGLLTSTERARRPEYSTFHDVTRFADHESDLAEFHPALTTPSADREIDDDHRDTDTAHVDLHDRVVDDTTRMLATLGWPADAARFAVAYLCTRLAEIGDRHDAYERLRRDKTIRAQLDWPHHTWAGLLRIVLGHPTAATPMTRRGVLVRLLTGEHLAALLADDDLVLAIDRTNPHNHAAHMGGGLDG